MITMLMITMMVIETMLTTIRNGIKVQDCVRRVAQQCHQPTKNVITPKCAPDRVKSRALERAVANIHIDNDDQGDWPLNVQMWVR